MLSYVLYTEPGMLGLQIYKSDREGYVGELSHWATWGTRNANHSELSWDAT